jgi:hypothetical protein
MKWEERDFLEVMNLRGLEKLQKSVRDLCVDNRSRNLPSINEELLTTRPWCSRLREEGRPEGLIEIMILE